jgi:hypothetical protein
MKIIGISGKAGSGKDTAYSLLNNYLQERGYSSIKLSFADKLKESLGILFGFDVNRLSHDFKYKESDKLDDGTMDPACERLGMTRRVIMQKYGTDAMRENFHQDVWIISLELSILRGEHNYDYGILTDARFLNEINFVKRLNGKMIKIIREGDLNTLTKETSHLSETDFESYEDWDGVVINHIEPSLSKEQNLSNFQYHLIRSLNLHNLKHK